MEPLIASTLPSVLRPDAAALHSELTTILRDGRLLAGEVLAGLKDGSVLLAIGRHQVPAQTDVQLEPGRPFLFRVEETRSGVLLRVLDGGRLEEPALLRALRAVISHERPLGELFSELAARLRAASGGAQTLPQRGTEQTSVLARLLAALGSHAALPEGHAGEGALLRQLFQQSGLRYEASLLAAAGAGMDSEPGRRLAGDLKGELLRFFRELAPGPIREAVARALAGIEAEQLLNVARERAGEPFVWSLPVPDGGAWTTLRMFLQHRGEREEQEDGSRDGGTRLVLGVSFQNTGPIRIDLLASAEALSVRLLATRDEVLERLRDDGQAIAASLESEHRRVHFVARRATEAEVEVGERPLDTRFLHEHQLMDVSG